MNYNKDYKLDEQKDKPIFLMKGKTAKKLQWNANRKFEGDILPTVTREEKLRALFFVNNI